MFEDFGGGSTGLYILLAVEEWFILILAGFNFHRHHLLLLLLHY
jgi:hypothetical protein